MAAAFILEETTRFTVKGIGAVLRRARRPDFPFVALFVGYPLWWILGLSQLAFLIAAIPLAVQLVRRKTVRVPRGFGVWLCFLVWMILSASMLEFRFERFVAFGYRAALYFSATIFFLWVYNMPQRMLPFDRILRLMLAFWFVALGGGYLGVLLGDVQLTSVTESLLPGALKTSDFVVSLVRPKFAQVQVFLGFDLNRPAAPFLFTNQWGANVALLTPLALAAWSRMRGIKGRLLMPLAVAALTVPAIVSVNRGLWLSLFVAGVYATFRRAQAGQRKKALQILGAFVIVAGMVVFTPLFGLVQGRAESDHANESRSALYVAVIESVDESPFFGFGAPKSNEENPNLPAVGTHGHFWTVLFSQGIPGVVLYVGFLGMMAVRTARDLTPERLWLHVTFSLLLVQMWFYNMLPAPLHIGFIVLAALLRPDRSPPETEAAAVLVNDDLHFDARDENDFSGGAYGQDDEDADESMEVWV